MKPLLALTAASALILTMGAVASAQTDVMVIEFTDPPGPPTQRIVVFVGEVACAEVRFDTASPPTALLGTEGQPAACSLEGAEVTFLQFRAVYGDVSGDPIKPFQLFNRTVFDAGSTFEFINWAPMPAEDPGPPDLLTPYMRAFVNAEFGPPPAGSFGRRPMRIEFVDPQSAAPIERLVLFVGTQACLSVSFDPEPPAIVYLGTADQPPVCGDDGIPVTGLQVRTPTQQLELSDRTLLVSGGSYRWANWAPVPPGSALPAYMQAFLNAGAVVQPAADGNAGLRDNATAPPIALLLLATLALLAGGRRMTAGRPD